MSNKNLPKKFIEDDFDLEQFKKESMAQKYKKFREQNEKAINVITFFIVVFSVIIAYLGYNILSYYIDLWKNKSIMQKAQNIAASSTPEPAAVTPSAAPAAPVTPVAEAVPTAAPDVSPTPTVRPMKEEILNLRTAFLNEDIVGRLIIEDTNINYAVVQASDNEFYLTRDLYKNENSAGSIFMDSDNTIEELGYNTVIYGHNMRDKSMFHNLRFYIDKGYYDEHKYITLRTLYEETKWEVFACNKISVDFNYIQTKFKDEQEFLALALEMKERSLYDTGVSIKSDDKILTLSTCTNEDQDTRYAIHAKLIETK